VEASVALRVEVQEAAISPFSLRQQWAVPRLLRQLGAQVYHSPYYLMPYRPGVPAVLTVYDLIPLLLPQYVSAQARLLFRWTMALALHAAARVLAISEATRRDLLSAYHLAPDKVTTVPLAADPCFHPQPASHVDAMRRQFSLPERYVLYLGINKPHKNLVRLVEAWAQLQPLPLPLVIAGAWDPRYPQPRQRAQALGLKRVILWLGPVPDASLPALYSGATVFVFPSLYEGFGLPVLEAMACGAPIICSNTSSLSEVTQGAALSVDPLNVSALTEALQRVLLDAELRHMMQQRGLAQAGRFSWLQTAEGTLAQYRAVTRRRKEERS
jgi:alpha-1,3-rhamnosyl/mannosyltransferase